MSLQRCLLIQLVYPLVPLVPGAKPFSIKPYRYLPVLKDEIEKQVGEMLEQGVIRKARAHLLLRCCW